MVIQYVCAALGAVMAAGIGWWAQELVRQAEEEFHEEAIVELQPISNLNEISLVDLGTGTPAQEQLASRLANARTSVFIAGASTQPVYVLVRDYIPWGVALEVLANPDLGGRRYLYEYHTRFNARVRTTDEIKAALITLFVIDGSDAITLREKDNAVVAAGDIDAVKTLLIPNRERWNRAESYSVA